MLSFFLWMYRMVNGWDRNSVLSFLSSLHICLYILLIYYWEFARQLLNTLLPSLAILVVQRGDAENRLISFAKEILQPKLRKVIESVVPSHKGRCRPRWHCTKDLETKEAAFPLNPPHPSPFPFSLPFIVTSPTPYPFSSRVIMAFVNSKSYFHVITL